MQKRSVVLGVLACALSMFISLRAEATYTYAPETYTLSAGSAGVSFINNGTGAATASFTSGGFTTTVTLSVPALNPPKGVGTSTLNVGDVTVATNAPTGAGQGFSFNFSDAIPITNPPPPGTAGAGTLFYTGTITVANATLTTGTVNASNLVASGSANVGTLLFTIDTPTFAFPTINGSAGNISANITQPNSVPAPASVVMLGLGMGAMGLVRVGRRFLAA